MINVKDIITRNLQRNAIVNDISLEANYEKMIVDTLSESLDEILNSRELTKIIAENLGREIKLRGY